MVAKLHIALRAASHAMREGRNFFLLSLCLAALLGGCDKPEAPQAQQPEVTVITVEPKDTPVSFEFVGVMASSQQVEVRARVDGFLDERIYTEGNIVKQGELMFQMDEKPFQAQLDAAQSALAQQQARLWTSQANLKRVKPLAKANALSKKELDDAQGRVNADAAAVDMARADVDTAQLNLGYTTIQAPVTGASSFARIQNGAYVNAQSGPLTYVAQLDPIWVDFSLSEDELLKFRQEQKSGQLLVPEATALTVELVLSDGSIYPETGRVFFTGCQLQHRDGNLPDSRDLQQSGRSTPPRTVCARARERRDPPQRSPGTTAGRAAGRAGFLRLDRGRRGQGTGPQCRGRQLAG